MRKYFHLALLASALGLPITSAGLVQQSKGGSSQSKEGTLKDRYVAAKKATAESYAAMNALVRSLTQKGEKNLAERDDIKKANEEYQKNKAEAVKLAKEVSNKEPTGEAGFDAMVYLIANGPANETSNVIEVMTKNHAARKGVGNSLANLPNLGNMKGFLQAIISKNANVPDKAAARYHLGMANLRSDTEEAEKLLEGVYKDYKDSKDPAVKRYASMAEPNLFELKFLTPGKVAPDIVGEDVDGVKFKLSDYRGKVVMLDFWGHW